MKLIVTGIPTVITMINKIDKSSPHVLNMEIKIISTPITADDIKAIPFFKSFLLLLFILITSKFILFGRLPILDSGRLRLSLPPLSG